MKAGRTCKLSHGNEQRVNHVDVVDGKFRDSQYSQKHGVHSARGIHLKSWHL